MPTARPASSQRGPLFFFCDPMQQDSITSMTDGGSVPLKRGRGRPAGAVQRLTVQEVAALLSVPLQTVYTWTRQTCVDGKPVLPKRKLGRLVRILATDVEALESRLALRGRPAVSFFVGSTRENQRG